MSPDLIAPPTVRRLLAALLRGSSDFDAFCFDSFPEVYRQLGPGMDRTQKENLLLQHAPTQAEIVEALYARFPNDPIWVSSSHEEPRSSVSLKIQREVKQARRPSGLLMVSLLLVALAPWIARALLGTRQAIGQVDSQRAVSQTECGALALDDVFVVKETTVGAPESILLDIRLRHTGSVAGAVNVTRVTLDCTERLKQRSPIAVTAAYDLLISGEHNNAPLAQHLASGAVDRILLRLGFTQEYATFQYTAKLRLQYNGTCIVESRTFPLSLDTAQHPGLVPAWPPG